MSIKKNVEKLYRSDQYTDIILALELDMHHCNGEVFGTIRFGVLPILPEKEIYCFYRYGTWNYYYHNYFSYFENHITKKDILETNYLVKITFINEREDTQAVRQP